MFVSGIPSKNGNPPESKGFRLPVVDGALPIRRIAAYWSLVIT